MRPIKLVLEGFTSFRDRQSLDFTNLDLFAITGPTGSGKTSLLDAITFALYGDVPRKVNTKDLVSQGKETLKVEFQFQVRMTDYRIIRTWRYRRRSPEIQFLLESLEGESWKPVHSTAKDASEILGMDFATFTRVVLLPQGKFAEFLIGEPRERRQILSQLIPDFKVFEIMQSKAGSEAERFKGLLQGIEVQQSELSMFTPEEIDQKQEQLKQLELEIKRLQTAIGQAQKVITEEERLLENLNRLANFQQTLSSLNAKLPELQLIQQKLQQAQAANQLQGVWEAVKSARERDQKAAERAEAIAISLNEANKNRDEQQTRLNEAQAKDSQLKINEEALATAGIFENQRSQSNTELSKAQKTQRDRKGKLDQAKQSLDEAQTTFEQVQKQLEAINQEIQQVALDESDRLNILQQVLGLLPTQRTLESEVQIAISNLDSATSATSNAQQTVQQTTLALEQANTVLEEARQALQQAIADNAVAALRQSLSEGDSCPVCQGLYPGHHLLSDVATVDLARLEKIVSQTETSQNQAQQKSTQAKSVLASHETKQATCQQELEAKKVRLSESCAAIASILQVEQWQADFLEQEHQALQAKDEAYRKALSKREKAEIDLNAKQQSLQFAQQVYSTASEEYEQANTDLAARKQQYQEIEEQLDSALSSLYQTLGKQPYQALKQSVEQQRQEFDAVLNTVRDAFDTAEKQLIAVTENHRNARQAVQESHETKDAKEQEWSNKLELSGFSESEFLTAQVSTTQQTDWQNQLDTYRQDKIQVETRIEEVTALISDKTTSEEAIAQRRQAVQADISQKSEAEVQHRELLGWLKQVESDRQKAETLIKQQETYAEQRDLHRTLANNLKSDEFQDYILEQFQEELTSQASTFLQDLTQRYSLTLENGKYRVRDGWNGDEARNLKTLSGGETFLSSLAMGLALSEKMARGTEIGSLFLDEGFGTLDAEALESVASALESLRGQHRLVGVITHVEDLADRIQTQVRVIKAPDGSRLEMIHS